MKKSFIQSTNCLNLDYFKLLTGINKKSNPNKIEPIRISTGILMIFHTKLEISAC